jgi:hypothetical protein
MFEMTRHRLGRGFAACVVALAAWMPARQALADHDDDWDDDGRHGRHDRYGWYSPWYGPGPGHHPREAYVFGNLDGYGCWRWVPAVGANLWFPYVDHAWRPYYYGHWVQTPLGITWVAYEPWGDVPHHYGRWVFVGGIGWGWVPGYEYAPAWVTWAVGSGAVGWAPLPPIGYRYPDCHSYYVDRHVVDYGFSGSFHYPSSGLDFSLWVFVSDRDFHGSSVYRHALPERQTLSYFKEKRVLPVGDRIDSRYLERVSGSKLPVVQVDRTTRSIGGRELQFVEPRGQQEKVRSGRDAAERVVQVPKSRERDARVEEARRGEDVRKAEEPRKDERTERSESSERSGKSRDGKVEKTTDGRTTKSR